MDQHVAPSLERAHLAPVIDEHEAKGVTRAHHLDALSVDDVQFLDRYLMRRGEIRVVDFEPILGAEADKRLPAVIVTSDGANIAAERLGRGVVTVVPITSAGSQSSGSVLRSAG